MTDTKNALAELAETLRKGYVSLVVNDRQVATFTTAAFPELDKAQRIVAELAKVFEPLEPSLLRRRHVDEPPRPCDFVIADDLRRWKITNRCREIAEEGENDAD